MSVVTNVILLCASFEKGLVAVNEYKQDDCLFNLVSIDDEKLPHGWYGGSKFFEGEVLIGAINYLNLATLIDYLRLIPWECPERVQLVVREEDDIRFRIIDLFPQKVADCE